MSTTTDRPADAEGNRMGDWPAVDILFDRLTPRGRVLLTADHAGVLCLIEAITLASEAGTVFTDALPWLDLRDRLTALFAQAPA